MEKKTLSIGTIREVTITPKNGGDPFTKLQIDLRQDVELYVKGEKVDFKTYATTNDGTDLRSKQVEITPVDVAEAGAKKAAEAGRLSDEDLQSILERNKTKNVRYNLSVSSRNLT